jgi:hypothetical protein
VGLKLHFNHTGQNENFPFDSPTLLPEPSSPWLLLAGVLALVGLRRGARFRP